MLETNFCFHLLTICQILLLLLSDISDQDIQEVAIPTGIPIIYKFDEHMKSIPPAGDPQTACQVHMKGLFMEKPGLLKEALKREEEWSKQIPGYTPIMGRVNTPMGSLERSLFKLRAERELGQWAVELADPNAALEDDGKLFICIHVRYSKPNQCSHFIPLLFSFWLSHRK